ncbi:MAG: MFS transporter [Planctomycetes bacterium]|nr:MFS transporter [Planctomycetota bacterium]MCC7061577.1 MFS transporter [Planctomycetota bacterium]
MFMLSDGALRMLVLLHLHENGQTPFALALLLLPYEAAGVVTNLLGGWLGGRFGQKPVLLTGLALQGLACLLLSVDGAWLTLPYVMGTQVLSGIAKDLAKTAAKSYVRVLAPTAASGTLFRVIAGMTGSKNAMKGLGFFAGGALLASAGFRGTNVALAVLLLVILVLAARTLPGTAPRARAALSAVLLHAAPIHWLAVARLFLFGSRDVWFAVALPLFLASSWGLGSAAVGGFLAVWVMGYGVVQAMAPKLVRAHDLRRGTYLAFATTLTLLAPLAITGLALQGSQPNGWVLAGLLLYGGVFAVTSSLHSWLVVAMAGAESTAERVGFYYAANALGRLAGTLASGWLFGSYASASDGLLATVLAAGGAVVIAALALLPTARLARSS